MMMRHTQPSMVSAAALLVWVSVFIIQAHVSSSFTPMIPPRFDNFGEQIVGTWSDKYDIVGDVEEVMRSCGGAVQGIREVYIPFLDDQDAGADANANDARGAGTYHNRADDGFVYFDCGSYTQGPLKLNTNDDAKNMIVGSVSFATLPKARVIFRTAVSNHDNHVTSWQNLIRTAQVVSGGGINADDNNNNQEASTIDRSKIQWNKYMICSKPSPNQPWMLQRCKYEKIVLDNDIDNNMEQKKKIDANDVDLRGWVDIIEFDGGGKSANAVDDENSIANLWGWCSDLEPLLLNGTSRIVQLGAICLTTGDAKALLRCYDDDQTLKAIILQHGIFP